jgi:hypothetical protein
MADPQPKPVSPLSSPPQAPQLSPRTNVSASDDLHQDALLEPDNEPVGEEVLVSCRRTVTVEVTVYDADRLMG